MDRAARSSCHGNATKELIAFLSCLLEHRPGNRHAMRPTQPIVYDVRRKETGPASAPVVMHVLVLDDTIEGAHEGLAARQWVADAAREGFDWSAVPEPIGLDASAMAVAAGIVEMLAGEPASGRRNGPPPSPAAPETVFLVHSSSPVLRSGGPRALRHRGLLATAEFLTVS